MTARIHLFAIVLVCALAASAPRVIAQSPKAPSDAPKTSDAAVLARARVLKRPEYPSDARNGGVSGSVTVRVVIDADGGIVSARGIAGPELLRTAAVKAVQSWEFASAANPDDMRGVLVFRFTLGESFAAIVGLRDSDIATHEPDRSADPEPVATTSAPPPDTQSAPAPAPPKRADRPTGPERLPDGVLAARATRRVPPRYPAAAESARIEGLVVVDLEVNEKGRVTSASVRSGPAMLRDAALTAAREWTFAPLLVDDVPTKVTGSISFNFRRSATP